MPPKPVINRLVAVVARRRHHLSGRFMPDAAHTVRSLLRQLMREHTPRHRRAAHNRITTSAHPSANNPSVLRVVRLKPPNNTRARLSRASHRSLLQQLRLSQGLRHLREPRPTRVISPEFGEAHANTFLS